MKIANRKMRIRIVFCIEMIKAVLMTIVAAILPLVVIGIMGSGFIFLVAAVIKWVGIPLYEWVKAGI